MRAASWLTRAYKTVNCVHFTENNWSSTDWAKTRSKWRHACCTKFCRVEKCCRLQSRLLRYLAQIYVWSEILCVREGPANTLLNFNIWGMQCDLNRIYVLTVRTCMLGRHGRHVVWPLFWDSDTASFHRNPFTDRSEFGVIIWQRVLRQQQLKDSWE